MTADVADRIAAQLPNRFLRGYARGKLRGDPVYAAAEHALRGQSHPLYDLGCGVGLLEFYLREQKHDYRMVGIDHDPRKIGVARAVASRYDALQFEVADARLRIPEGHNVAALDVLHYFTTAEQEAILRAMAHAVPPGGMVILRDCVRDDTLRYRLTQMQERFSRAIRWLRAQRLHFPTREQIVAPFQREGFQWEVRPLWGRTPFNNYFFVFRRSGSGMTNR